MRAYLAKDYYGTSAFINQPELIDCEIFDETSRTYKMSKCWSGKVYDFSVEVAKEIEKIGSSLIECNDVKEVEITVNIEIV